METKVIEPKDLDLKEAMFDEIESFKPNSLVFLLTCSIFYWILPLVALHLSLDQELLSELFLPYFIIFFGYIILIGNKYSVDKITGYRLKKTLNFFR